MNNSSSIKEGTAFTTTEYDYSGFVSPCEYGPHASRFLPVLYSLFFVVGFPSNMLVLWVMLKGVQLKTMTDVSLVNMAIADLLLIFTLPFLAHYARDTWVFGNAMCTLVLSVYYIGFYAGIFFIVLMTTERYLAIVHSLFAMRIRTKSLGSLASMIVWIVAVAASFPELLDLGIKDNENKVVCSAYPKSIEDHNEVKSAAFIKMNVLGMLIPLIIVGFCYSMVLRKLQSCQTSKKRAIRLVVVVMVVFFCCWIPYNVAALLKTLELKGIIPQTCDNSKRIRLMLQVTEAMAYSHSCLNPFLYVFVGEKFKRQFARLLLQTPCIHVQCLKRYLTLSAGSEHAQTRNVDKFSLAI